MKKMIQFLLTFWVVISFVSCKESHPNDRALYNLQGAVQSITTTNLKDKTSETIRFGEAGFYAEHQSDYEVERGYGKLILRHKKKTITHTLQYDSEGRLEERFEEDLSGEEPLYRKYEYTYKGKERLPESIERIVKQGDDRPVVTNEDVVYKVDDLGNWTSFAWAGEQKIRKIQYYTTPEAATDNCPLERSINWFEVFMYLFVVILFIGVPYMLFDMLRENFFRHKRRTNYTVKDFQELRRANGSSKMASESENAKADEYLEEAFGLWDRVTQNEEGEDLYAPVTKKVMRQSDKLFQQVIDIKPTDEATIKRLNDLLDILNKMEKRSFCGSKMFIGVTALIAAIGAWGFESMGFASYLGVCIIVYIFSTRRPQFMLIYRSLYVGEEKSTLTSGILGMIFGTIATAHSTTVVTKWSDGSTTRHEDHTSWFVQVGLGVFLMILMACLISVISILNYLRNYVFYK